MGHLDSATALDAVPQPYLDDGDVQLYHGDVTATLRSLPAGIAQTCITSPPYWGLRSYLPDGHDDKATELGLEATPDQYVERMVAVFREVWRVLRDDGTVWLNLGDSYNAQPKGNTKPRSEQGNGSGRYNLDSGQSQQHWQEQGHRARGLIDGLKPKDLVGIPWRVAFALQTDGWYLRSDIVWSKPNPMPESVSDRPTKAHEYLFLLSKRPRYFYDADAIREPFLPESLHTERVASGQAKRDALGQMARTTPVGRTCGVHENGRNRRSVWTIPTEPFPEAHFATYPQALVRPCILAGTSEHGECSNCGAPWMRISEREFVKTRGDAHSTDRYDKYDAGSNYPHSLGGYGRYDVTTTGWRASCTCDAPTRPQLVLDPFIGSGTTALVARNHGRRCIGIDLSAEYLNIAAKRLQQLSLLGGTT